jgi:PBP1b-binding outer membrane lipoprotein LpoB
MLKIKAVLLLLILIALLHSCNSVEPPPDNVGMNLSLEDVSSIEAWLKLTTNNLQLPTTVTLKQNDQTRKSISLITTDTLLHVDSLLPNTNYSFQASSIQSAIGGPVSSNQLQVTTMDTTSHNFSWQTWTFGEHSSSVLRDVAIIDENNIWAVGEIYLNDSLGQPDPKAYNAIHWDGIEWRPKKITVEFRGNFITPPLEGVFAFSETEIWMSSGVPIRGDGVNWIQYHLFDMGILNQDDGSLKKIWGINSNDIYYVGNKGTIVHYNGTSWQKIESGTDVKLTDIYGTTDRNEVWACGWNSSDGHTILLRVALSQSEIIYDSFNPAMNLPYNDFISSLWTNGKQYFWLTGVSDGIVKHSFANKSSTKKENFTIQYFPYRIRGSELNDVAVAGAASMLWHYNEYSWVRYEELLNINDRLRSMDMKDEVIVAVGLRFDSILPGGLIVMGRR